MATLHVHTDESGDLNFKATGSPHYYFTVVWTREPSALAAELRNRRFAWLRDGVDIPRFHACVDKPATRIELLNMMSAHPEWQFSSIVIPKAKLWAMYRKPAPFYTRFLQSALSFVFRGSVVASGIDRVLVYTDTLPNMNASREGVEKAINLACGSELKPRGITYSVFHHPSASNKWLQVADYCCYALQRKHDHGDLRYYDILRGHLRAPELVLWK